MICETWIMASEFTCLDYNASSKPLNTGIHREGKVGSSALKNANNFSECSLFYQKFPVCWLAYQ